MKFRKLKECLEIMAVVRCDKIKAKTVSNRYDSRNRVHIYIDRPVRAPDKLEFEDNSLCLSLFNDNVCCGPH